MEDKKFHEQVKEYFWVDSEYIKALLQELEDNRVEDITLTEQFNKGFLQWMQKAAEEMEKYFSENVKQSVQDFNEIDPNANVENTERESVDWKVVEDIVVTDKIVDRKWNL